MARPSCQIAPARLLAALLLVAVATAARGEGLSGTAEVRYVGGDTTNTDSTGHVTSTSQSLIPQRYRLSYDKSFFPFLVLDATGYYEWTPGWTNTDGVPGTLNANRWNVYASLLVGPPVLNATPFYSRREEYAWSGTNGVDVRSPTLVSQSYGVYAGWNPAGLPLVNLRFARTDDFDGARAFRNTVNDEVVGNLSYLEVQNLALRYTFRWGNVDDRITSVKSSDINQSAQVTWSGTFLERRLATSVNYLFGYRINQIQAGGGGTVRTQQFPVGGLSLVETFPAIPGQDTLLPNPALIDGDVFTSAGLDIGFGPSLSGDQNYRDMGVQFAGTATEINLVWLWVDKVLPPAVAAGYTFSAWVSDDNVAWTEIPLAGPVVFGTFNNRFEIPLPRIRSRFVKVVTRPLTPGVTTDPQYQTVLVTEMQTYLEVPANEVPTKTEQWGGNLTASARILMVRDWNFAYTIAFSGTHQDSFDPNDWSVLNSVTAGKQLSQLVSVAAQVSRTDSGQTNTPHEAVNRWSAQVGLNPFSTLGAALTYSGQYGQLYQGEILNNNVTLTGHLDPWTGVSLAATLGYSWARDEVGHTSTSPNATVSLTLVPMPALTVTGTYGITSSLVANTVRPVPLSQSTSLQGNVTFTPVRALFFSAGIIRSTGNDAAPQTLANFSAGLSPFSGGQMLLRFGYNENVDTQAKSHNRVFGPGLRWNLRPGAYLDVGYTWNDTVQPALLTQARNLYATLFLSFM